MCKYLIILFSSFLLSTICAQTIENKINVAENYFEKGSPYLSLDLLNQINEEDLLKSPNNALKYYALKSELYYSISDAENALQTTHSYKNICNKFFKNKPIYFSYNASMYCKYYNLKASADSIIWFAKQSIKLWSENKANQKLVDSWFIYNNFANARRNVMSLTPQNTNPVASSLFCDTAIALLKNSGAATPYKLARLYQTKAMVFLDLTTEASQKLYGDKFSREMWAKSTDLLNNALKLYKSINPKHPAIPQILSLIALEEFYFNQFKQAIKHYDEAEGLILEQDTPFAAKMCWTYATILRWKEWLLVKQNSNPTAIELQKRIEILKKAETNWSFLMFDLSSKQEDVFSDSYNINPNSAIAENYAKLYTITEEKKFIDSAYQYAEKQKYVLFNRNNKSIYDSKYFNYTIKKWRLHLDSISLGYTPKLHIKKQEVDSINSILNNKEKNTTISLNDLQKSLSEDEAILYYFINPQQTHAKLHVLVIQKDNIKLNILPTEKILDNSSRLLISFNEAMLKAHLADVKKYGFEIYSIYFATAFKGLNPAIKKLILLPPAFLQSLPINCVLQDTSGSNFKTLNYIVKRYNLSYQLSGYTYLKSLLDNKTQQGYLTLTSLASEYQYSSQNETSYGASLINRLSRNYKIVSLSPDCNKNQFLRSLEKSKVFHFTGHASSVSTLNSLTNLYLSRDSVSIFDIYKLNLDNNKLCVFNGCLSGIGKIINTEGQNDFARALTMKGCKAQVLNKTKADDKTSAVILEKFYRLMNSGLSKSEALAEAQRQYLAEADVINSNPLYWNSLFVIGNDQPIYLEINTSSKKWLFLFPVAGISLFLFLIFKCFQKK